MRRQVEIDILSTGEELADAWCELGADEQARFFNKIGFITKGWAHGSMAMQLQWVSGSTALTMDGRGAMMMIGEYGEASRVAGRIIKGALK